MTDAERIHTAVILAERIHAAIDIAVRYGGNDGSHHKMWVIDQMVRVLTGCPPTITGGTSADGTPWSFTSYGECDEYHQLVAAARAGEGGPETYSWDVGVAP